MMRRIIALVPVVAVAAACTMGRPTPAGSEDGIAGHSESGQQKNRRKHDVPLRAEMVAALRKHLANKLPKAKAFYVAQRCAQMLRDDMEAAGLIARGYDFHCLRHTCGTFLASAGVELKLVQQVLGHKTFKLTADVYTHLYDEALHEGVTNFPNLEVG